MQGSQQQSSMAAPNDAALETLSADLLWLLSEGHFSDVTFEVEGRQVFAHRCVLAARSPFFRTIFCGSEQLLSGAMPRAGTPQVIPVGIVGYDVFILLLQFLYSGTLCLSAHSSGRGCSDKACRHTHCSSAVEFGLEMLNAAVFFGIDQLSTITQKHLGAMAEKASIEDVMRMLKRAGKKDELHLWNLCSKLVAKSGLSVETLQKYLDAEVVRELEAIRQKAGYGIDSEQAMAGNHAISEQKTRRMQKALDSSDVELVKLMVMGEGLDLDKAFALHYAVNCCSRKVVKTLLDLGAANVNLRGPDGRTPLHMAAHLGDPEKIAVLLDHQADPHMQSATGATAMDIVQSGATEVLSAGRPYNSKVDQNRLRLCIDLLERAAAVVAAAATTTTTTTTTPTTTPLYPAPQSINVESDSPASILTEHGSSTLLPEESDNFRGVIGSSAPNHLTHTNDDFFASFSNGLSGRVHGRESAGDIRDNTGDSISRLLFSCNALSEFDYAEQQLQAESRNYSMLDSISTMEGGAKRPRRLPCSLWEPKDLPILREVSLKDITNDATESFKSVYNAPHGADEEVSSAWQLFLQEQSDALASNL